MASMKSPLKSAVLLLADTLVEASDWTHSKISNRVVGGGTFFNRMKSDPDAGFTDKTYIRFISWFHENWPPDLSWPDEIQRPDAVIAA